MISTFLRVAGAVGALAVASGCRLGKRAVLRGHHVRRLVALGVAVAASAVPIGAFADTAPGSPVESNYERVVGPVQRDCGFSQQLPGRPGQSIWLFCDTLNPNVDRPKGLFLPGSTAAEGPFTRGRAPTDLSEVPTPPAAIGHLPSKRAPEHFLPAPMHVVLPDGKACSVPGKFFSATWITGVAREPAALDGSKLLISFVDVCVGGGGIKTEHFGLAEYRPATNARPSMTRVFNERLPFHGLLPQLALGSPIFSKGKLYLFAFRCTTGSGGQCTAGGAVFLARTDARPSSWQHAGSYQFFDPRSPGGWTSNPAKAAPLIAGAAPLGISVDDYASVGHGLALIEQTTLGGGFRIWTAASPVGPWRSTSGKVPCNGGHDFDLCRALIGHPELSSRTELRFSYFNPAPSARHALSPTLDHVLLTSTPW